MDTTTLLLSVLFGAIGSGYFIYGKRQQRLMPMLCGAALVVLPYIISSPWWTAGVSLMLMVVPFILVI